MIIIISSHEFKYALYLIQKLFGIARREMEKENNFGIKRKQRVVTTPYFKRNPQGS
jgi:hypothetical protein